MFKHEGLSIRRVDIQDIEFLIELRSLVWESLGNIAFLSKINQEEWIVNTTKDVGKLYCILSNEYDENIGMVRFDEIDYINRSIRVGGDITPKHQGRGYGTKMMRIIKKYCFDYLNMNRLWLMVLESNIKAYNLYIKEGFEEEGRQRQAIYRNGEYQDYILMGMLK